MTNFAFFNFRWSAAGALATLCITGAVSGLLYAFVFFGNENILLVEGALAGALITLFYGLLEIKLFPGITSVVSLFSQYFLRVLFYFLLFSISLFLVTFLHAHYTKLFNDITILEILREDYLPYWPAYFIYALLAAFVFQSIWLFNKINAKSNDQLERQSIKSNAVNGAVIIIGLVGNKSVLQEQSIKIFDKISEKLTRGRDDVLEYYEYEKLKVYLGKKSLTDTEVKALEQTLNNLLVNHIGNEEKMLQLQMGYGFGEVHIQACGSQKIFHGEAVKKAEADLKPVSHITQNKTSNTFAFPFFI